MELLDIVDENGTPTGKTVSRAEAHRSGIRHRTAHVWLMRQRDDDPELLLQKRSQSKDSYPGCYDISSAGHIPAGEDFLDSALRELREELGITAAPEELEFCGLRRFFFRDRFHGAPFLDRQVCRIYLLRRDLPETAFCLQQSEVEAVRWFPLAACFEMAKTASSPNCLYTEELELVQNHLEAGD